MNFFYSYEDSKILIRVFTLYWSNRNDKKNYKNRTHRSWIKNFPKASFAFYVSPLKLLKILNCSDNFLHSTEKTMASKTHHQIIVKVTMDHSDHVTKLYIYLFI